MREIKFRAWDGSKMVVPACIGEYGEWYETGRDYENGIGEKEGLMQSTGLKDKNGKEIFEGDIVCLIELNRLYTAEWDEFGFKLFHADPNLNKLQWGGLNYVAEFKWTIEVIGNTYEHKHLLK